MSAAVFPHIWGFHSLNYGTEEIDILFKRGEVHFDWYLRSKDRLNPIIRAAFNLDGIARDEGCSHEEEAPEKEGDESSQLAVDLRNLRNIGNLEQSVEGEGREVCAGEEVAGEAHDEAAGQANEAPTTEAPTDEALADEERAAEGHEEVAHEEPADEERASEPHEEGPADAHEEVADEEPAGEPLDHPPPFIDIGDDDDDGHVEPLVVVPLRSYAGDPRTTIDLDLLYNAVTRRDIPRSYVSEIMGQLLTIADCSTLGPRQCVDNMTLIFAATMFIYFEKRVSGVIKRMVFILVVSDGHWWCYAMKVCTFQLFVIDSLEKGIKGHCWIDRSIAQKIQRLWCLLTNTIEDSKCPLLVQQAKISVQPNTYDCGVIMMKAIDIWDGEEKYDGKSMFDYTNVGKKFIWDWILDEHNVRRIETLQQFGLI
ncbi:hypothetical protein V8G54_009796 [Vigna mungo]|uniref:Ubiquitin-like protease family profile domain-containing protein n=1 Tax=Vigna mungo TaxID=3915 RepID=A0AAQ3NVH3_VIGMU